MVVYGLVYDCKCVGLAYPRRRAQESNLELIGTIKEIQILKISMNLGAANVYEEELRLVNAIRELTKQL